MGWGRGSGVCVCLGALRPASASRPPSRCRLPAGPCVYTRARRRARAAPGHLRLAHVWAHAPLRLPLRPVTFAGTPARISARRPLGSAGLPQAPRPVPGSQPALWDSPPRCPADTCPPADGRTAAADAAPLPRSLSRSPVASLPCAPLAGRTPPLGIQSGPFLLRPPQCDFWNLDLRGILKRACLVREVRCLWRSPNGFFSAVLFLYSVTV